MQSSQFLKRSSGNARARFRFKRNSTRLRTFRALARSSANVSAPSKMRRASAFWSSICVVARCSIGCAVLRSFQSQPRSFTQPRLHWHWHICTSLRSSTATLRYHISHTLRLHYLLAHINRLLACSNSMATTASLQPENIMIDHMGHIRLIDFGFAQRLKSDNARLTSGCGTAMYLAPEIAEGKTNSAHGLPVDWWSLGCVIFEMLTGTAPFGDTADSNKFEIFNKIIKGKVKYPGYITTEAKSLLTGLICVDSGVRYKYADLHSHAWYKGVAWDAVLRCEMVPPWVPPIKDGEGDHGNFLDWKDNQPRRSRVTGDAVEYCNFKLPKSCMPKGGKWATAVVRQNSFTRTGVGVGGSGGTSANFGNTAAAAITMKKKLKTKRLSQVSPDSKKALKETGGTANSVEAGGAKAKGGVTRAGSSRELGRRSSGIKRQGPGQLARQGSGVKRQAASEGGTSPKLAPEILTSPKSGSGPRNGAVEKGGLARAPGGGGLNPKATPQGGR
mmetsp:Transcript_36666/g.98246  ORF Transcript_36666/g.98246 Transcript_36666/m.98246 type:complete len:502 (-) Transcript_36666:73-1578(-)